MPLTQSSVATQIASPITSAALALVLVVAITSSSQVNWSKLSELLRISSGAQSSYRQMPPRHPRSDLGHLSESS